MTNSFDDVLGMIAAPRPLHNDLASREDAESSAERRWCTNRRRVGVGAPEYDAGRAAGAWGHNSPMPYKHNEPRRHNIPKARYRVENWRE